MAEPTKQDREAARQIAEWFANFYNKDFSDRTDAAQKKAIRYVASTLANERARIKAEDVEIARRVSDRFHADMQFELNERNNLANGATTVYNAILSSSSCPALEERVRAEIAERVKALEVSTRETGDYLDRDDVLAIINGGEK